MKVALLISGYLRSFKLNILTIKERIINKFDSVDIYLHITEKEENEDKYLNIDNDIQDFITEFNPTILYESNYIFSNNSLTNNVINSWLKLYKLNELRKINEIHEKYDLVIKYRPDTTLISDNIFMEIEDNVVYIPNNSKIDKNKLRNVNDNYICDIFAYGKPDIMNKYFSVYENIDFLINKYGNVPETILYYHLIENNIVFKYIDLEYNVILSTCNVFSITGDSGSGKSRLANVLKKHFSKSFLLECDRYHKWNRYDDNWKKMTHLNPESNLLLKMNSDIFDLKIGKNIYHVDYDHNTGNFTDVKSIESSDNIIVCGLHNLYEKTDILYDLKIFMDTDEKLKMKWKINRDVNERKYELETVLKNIEDRKEDFYKYILPQREISDVIINFFNEEELSLRIIISSKYNMYKIVSNFEKLNISFTTKLNNNTFELIFVGFEPNKIKFDNIPIENNLYDYIILILYNIIEIK